MFVKISNRFKCEVWVTKDGEQVNGKSIMGLMILAAEEGAKIVVSVEKPVPLVSLMREMPLVEQAVGKGNKIQVTLKAKMT